MKQSRSGLLYCTVVNKNILKFSWKLTCNNINFVTPPSLICPQLDLIVKQGCRAPAPLNSCHPQHKHILTRHILILFKTAFFDRKPFHWQIFTQKYLICHPSSHMCKHQNYLKKVITLPVHTSLDCFYQVSSLFFAGRRRNQQKLDNNRVIQHK